jgi:flagellar hook-length control protein FliK
MQAVSISNALPATSPVSGAASLISPAPQQWSPFAAILRAKLNAGNETAKLPAGRAKDSARAQDVAGTTISFPGAAPLLLGLVVCSPVLSAQPLSNPANATIADSTGTHDPVPAMASTQSLACADAQSLAPANSVQTKVPQVANIATLESKLIAQILDTTPNRYAPSNITSTGTPKGQGGAAIPDAVGTPSDAPNLSSAPSVRTNVPTVASTATLDSKLVIQIADTAPNHSSSSKLHSTGTPLGHDSAKSPDTGVAQPDSQKLSSTPSAQTNAPAAAEVPQPVANIATFDPKLVVKIADAAPDGYAAPNLPSSSDSLSARNLLSASSVQTAVPPVATIPQPSPHPAIPDVNSTTRIFNAVLNHEPPPTLSPAGTVGGQDSANATQTDTKAAALNSPGVPNFQILRANNAGLELLNFQTSESAPVQATPIEQTPQSAATDNASRFNPKLEIGRTAVVSAAPVQTTTKTMAPGVSTPIFREALQSQGANIAPLGPAGVAPARSQSKDTSNTPQGNDANAKSDHAPNSSVGRVDGKGFGQTLGAAGETAGSAHSASPDSTLIGAPMQAPVESRTANGDVKLGGTNAASLPQEQAMHAAAGADQTVVSSARLMDHPGQTEIRIEMQSDSLGGVELRAHISGNQIGASIAVEHHDAQVLLANDLPALHNALAEKNLRIDSLSVSQGMPSSTAGGPGSDASYRGFSQGHPKPVYARLDEVAVPVSEPPLEYLATTHVNARLSVLA